MSLVVSLRGMTQYAKPVATHGNRTQRLVFFQIHNETLVLSVWICSSLVLRSQRTQRSRVRFNQCGLTPRIRICIFKSLFKMANLDRQRQINTIVPSSNKKEKYFFTYTDLILNWSSKICQMQFCYSIFRKQSWQIKPRYRMSQTTVVVFKN